MISQFISTLKTKSNLDTMTATHMKPFRTINTHSVRSFHAFRLFAETKVFFAAKHLENEFSIEDGDFRLELANLVQQHPRSFLDFFPSEVGTALCWPLHHICEADTILLQFVVFLGGHLH